jgi:hypothetical protein
MERAFYGETNFSGRLDIFMVNKEMEGTCQTCYGTNIFPNLFNCVSATEVLH